MNLIEVIKFKVIKVEKENELDSGYQVQNEKNLRRK